MGLKKIKRYNENEEYRAFIALFDDDSFMHK